MINADIKVSVIMPIYNAYDYLVPAMDSVLDQTLREIELICVDDGSTDSSYEIIKEYQKQDPRVRIITETNAGPALARNNGLKRARGEYIAFLDADDFFEPTLLEELYKLAKEKDLDIAITDYDLYINRKATFEVPIPAEHEEIYANGRLTSKNKDPDTIFLSTNGAVWNKLFRRSFITEKQLQFLSDVKIYEDVYFVATALSFAGRIGKVEKTLMHNRVYTEQSRTRLLKKYFSHVLVAYIKIKEFLVHNGMYAPLSDSFLNLTAGDCYKIFNLLRFDCRDDFWNLLNSEYAEKFGWKNKTSEDYDEESVCEFASNVQLYNYNQ